MNERKDEKPGDSDRLLDHSYDGIQEYDNPMPRWWVYVFWATIAFSVLYLFNLPGIGNGKGRIANYEREMAAARAAHPAPPASEEITDEALLGMARAPAELAEGRAVYRANCVPCHRADGGGSIGPNLTDAYWLHGGRPMEVYRTARDGVLAKGMPAWGQVLKADELTAAVAYVMSLGGTNPPNPRAAEGTNADSTASVAGVAPTREGVERR
jgi:cytochrome c oxidase cbb3-type subunit 3